MTEAAAAARRGLFLDLDGTLADTLPSLRAAYRGFLARFGVTGDEAEFERLNGPPLQQIVASLKAAHSLPGAIEDLIAAYRALMQERHAAAAPNDGAAELLSTAAVRGWIVSVVTSNPRDATAAWLDRVGLAARVAVIVGGDEATRPKPDAAPYRLALARSGCAAALSIAIEDGVQGSIAAMAAGLPTWRLGEMSPVLADSPFFRGTLPNLRAALRLL